MNMTSLLPLPFWSLLLSLRRLFTRLNSRNHIWNQAGLALYALSLIHGACLIVEMSHPGVR